MRPRRNVAAMAGRGPLLEGLRPLQCPAGQPDVLPPLIHSGPLYYFAIIHPGAPVLTFWRLGVLDRGYAPKLRRHQLEGRETPASGPASSPWGGGPPGLRSEAVSGPSRGSEGASSRAGILSSTAASK